MSTNKEVMFGLFLETSTQNSTFVVVTVFKLSTDHSAMTSLLLWRHVIGYSTVHTQNNRQNDISVIEWKHYISQGNWIILCGVCHKWRTV